ncbi:hypothetical protein BS47DRAFT_1368036 [Hydnum rufescens UP504]|uniref:Uncharacterized protein n=1 Tax=Hydnum rufescens UP504 TaxID=1448309 RepID=A0A9P6AGV5_9AGAM|nr:hypothetical protein BS47DRAFT_1368036 [Hydnum rufescens UP504]
MSLPPPDSATGQDQLHLIYQLLMSQFNTAAAATSPGLNSAQPPDTTVLTTPAQQPATPLPTHLPLIPPLAPPPLYTGHATETMGLGTTPTSTSTQLTHPSLWRLRRFLSVIPRSNWRYWQGQVKGPSPQGPSHSVPVSPPSVHQTALVDPPHLDIQFYLCASEICIVHEDFQAHYLYHLNEANHGVVLHHLSPDMSFSAALAMAKQTWTNSLWTFHMVDGIFTFYIASISPFLETNVGVLGGCVLYAETDGDDAYHDEALCELIECPDDSMAQQDPMAIHTDGGQQEEPVRGLWTIPYHPPTNDALPSTSTIPEMVLQAGLCSHQDSQTPIEEFTLTGTSIQDLSLQLEQMEELVLLTVVCGHTDSPHKFHSFNQGMQLETWNGFHFLELAARFKGGLPGLLGVLQGGKIISLSTLLENVQLLSIPGHLIPTFPMSSLISYLDWDSNVALAQSQGLLMLGDQIGEDLDSQDPSLRLMPIP